MSSNGTHKTALRAKALPAAAALAVLLPVLAYTAVDGRADTDGVAQQEQARGPALGRSPLPPRARALLHRDVPQFAMKGEAELDVLAVETVKGKRRLLLGFVAGQEACTAEYYMGEEELPAYRCGPVTGQPALAVARRAGGGSAGGAYLTGHAPVDAAYVIIRPADGTAPLRTPAVDAGQDWQRTFFIQSLRGDVAVTVSAYNEQDELLMETSAPGVGPS